MNAAPNETRLVSYFVAQLNLQPFTFAWRSSTGAAQTATRLVRFGKKGQGDITGLCRGRFFVVEVKTETGVQSPAQKLFQQHVEHAGGIYIVARSLEDLKPIFDMAYNSFTF